LNGTRTGENAFNSNLWFLYERSRLFVAKSVESDAWQCKGCIMKKLSLFLLVFIFWISGCTFNVDVLTPTPPATPIPTQTIVSPVATISPTAEFSFTHTPTPVAPMITEAVFVTDAPVNQNGKIFPAGIKQIFVLYNSRI
jgi:hypothetical protein